MGLKAARGQNGQWWAQVEAGSRPHHRWKPWDPVHPDGFSEAGRPWPTPPGQLHSLFRLGLGTFSTYSSTRPRSLPDTWLRRSRSTPCQAGGVGTRRRGQHPGQESFGLTTPALSILTALCPACSCPEVAPSTPSPQEARLEHSCPSSASRHDPTGPMTRAWSQAHMTRCSPGPAPRAGPSRLPPPPSSAPGTYHGHTCADMLTPLRHTSGAPLGSPRIHRWFSMAAPSLGQSCPAPNTASSGVAPAGNATTPPDPPSQNQVTPLDWSPLSAYLPGPRRAGPTPRRGRRGALGAQALGGLGAPHAPS